MFSSRSLINNATVSVVQTIISGVVLFLLYRYLINHLGSEQLGLWSVILASTSVARLSDLGLTGSVVKFVARYRALNDDEKASAVVQTSSISIALIMGVLALIIYPLLDGILKLTIPTEAMPQALSILPWAVLSLWLSSVGSVFQSGLDGCQRMVIRNILMIIANLLFFTAALWLVPHYGLLGLAMGQAAQGLMLLMLSWLMLRRELNSLPWIPICWSKKIFKETFNYAVNFQINSVAVLLFEPVTKLLMSKYGGLSSAAYYEMASQLVLKLRALLISANQALVPTVAELHETTPGKIQILYLQAYKLVFFLAVPFYVTILIALPMISVLWIGHRETQFLMFGALLVSGWCLNTITAPAYFINLGTGDLKWNSISHVIMGTLNVIVGLILGPIFGALGVAISAMISLVFASGLIIFMLHRQYKIPITNMIPSEHYWLLLATIFSMVLALIVEFLFEVKVVLMGVLCLGAHAFIVGIAMWFHSYGKWLFAIISSLGLSRRTTNG